MAARVGGFLVDLLVLFLLDSWANWLFGVAVVTSAVHSGNSGTSTFVYQPPWPVWIPIWIAYFGWFGLVYRSTLGQMIVRRSGRRSWQRSAATTVLIAGLLAGSLAFDYYGRPPLAVQSAAAEGQLLGAATYKLGDPQWSGDLITYPVRFRRQDNGWACEGHVQLEWGGFGPGWHLGPSDAACHAPTLAGR